MGQTESSLDYIPQWLYNYINLKKGRALTMQVRPRVFHYGIDVKWKEQRRGILRAAEKQDLEVATPPEFKGHPGIWTPEDLFVASVNSCLMSTFLGMAERAGVHVQSYEAHGDGTLESVNGFLQFTKVVLRPRIAVANQEEVAKALDVLQKAKIDCLVARSLNTEVILEGAEVYAAVAT